MNTPTGYSALDLVGFTPKGDYSGSATYVQNDIVRYNNNLWRCKLDDTSAQTPAEGTYWTLFIEGSTLLSSMTDTAISSPANGDVLEYDSTSGKWKNSDVIGEVKQALADVEEYVLETGVENILPNDRINSGYDTSLFSVDSDGVLTINGAAAASTNKEIVYVSRNRKNFFLPNGDYILSGMPTDNTNGSVYMSVSRTVNGSNSLYGSTTNGVVRFTVNGDDYSNDGAYISVYVDVNNTTANNIVCKPMLTKADVPNSDYAHFVPYAKTNRELTKDDSGLTANAFANGCVNELENTASSQVVNGITFTVNADKSVSVSASNITASTSFAINGSLKLPKGRHKLSGTLGGGEETYKLQYIRNGNIIASELGDGLIIDVLSDSDILGVNIRIPGEMVGHSISTTFKPMITVADMPNSDYNHYVPYAKSNKQLTNMVKSKTFSETTTTNGNVNLSMASNQIIVAISAHKSGSVNENVVCIPYKYASTAFDVPGGAKVILGMLDNGNIVSVNNTAIEGTVWYLEI